MLLVSLLLNLAQANELKYDWHWRTVPDIEICEDSDMEVNDVSEAIAYWSKRGVYVEINSIYHVEECDMSKLNVIQITGYRDFDRNNYHAMTNVKWFYFGEKTKNTMLYIDRVYMQMPNNILASRKDILLHEFGHAFGLGHSNDSIMKSIH